MTKKVDPEDIIDLTGIAEKTGINRNTVRVGFHRGRFPALRDDLKVGPIFHWPTVEAALKAEGAIK